jgi:hypothetical protein
MAWSPAEVAIPAGMPSGVSAVAVGQMGVMSDAGPANRNFIAIASDGSAAWTSLTASWSAVPFLPAGATDEIRSIAVLGRSPWLVGAQVRA